MRKVELKMNEKEKYEIIKELVDHNGNKNRASKKLGISKRQINRLIVNHPVLKHRACKNAISISWE